MDVAKKSTRCGHPNKHPSYGIKGSKTAEFWAGHAREDRMNAKRKRYAHSSCNKQPKHSLEGGKTAEFCAPHAKERMVDQKPTSG